MNIRSCTIIPQAKSQAGVTLMLSLLILASMLAISFSLATILFVEIRSSADVLKSEPSFYASEAITEQGLYYIKREVPTASTTWPTTIGNVSIANPVLNPLASPVQQVIVPPFSLTGQSAQYYYDNTNNRYFLESLTNALCANVTDPCGGYGGVKITYLQTAATDSLYVYICEHDPSNPTQDCTHVISSCPATFSCDFSKSGGDKIILTPSQSTDFISLNVNKQYEIRLVNSNTNGQTLLAQVETFESDGVTRKGIPYIGQRSVESNASNNGVTRSVKTVIPTP